MYAISKEAKCKDESECAEVAVPLRRSEAAGFSALMPSQGTIYGHYGGLFLALLMDSAQLLSIMEKDGHTSMPEGIVSAVGTLH